MLLTCAIKNLNTWNLSPMPNDIPGALQWLSAKLLLALKECKMLPVLISTKKHQETLRNSACNVPSSHGINPCKVNLPVDSF